MKTPEFNLIEEPWIRVIDSSCTIHEVSIQEALCNAHQYVGLRGELPTQDVAILRLLIAIVHTVFYRVNMEGDKQPIEDEEMACERWKKLWEYKHFPQKAITDYLERWKDRFWLFHDSFPFYQTGAAGTGTVYTAAKLNGEISESSNKTRLFSSYAGLNKGQLSYAEAARWLMYVNAYDDTSAKPKGKGLPSPGVGWLGKLGLLYAVGKNLYETILLNTVFLKDGQELCSEDHPIWEEESVRSEERAEIEMPDNQAQLLTLQSRRLLLIREGHYVTGYSLLGGDFFDRANASQEQMTVWLQKDEKSSALPVLLPRRHDVSKQMWREFPDVFGEKTITKRPGIVSWISFLKYQQLIDQNEITFRIASVQYGDKDFFVTDVFSDALTFHTSLLTELGTKWIDGIKDEIENCNSAANYLRYLENEIARATGREDGANTAKEQFYYRIDAPFRRWIESLDPDAGREDISVYRNKWRKEAADIARQLGKELISNAGTAASTGRMAVEKVKGKEQRRYYSAPEAYNRFQYQIKKLYDI